MTRSFLTAVVVVLLAGCEPQPFSRAYVETLGTDTTSVEVFTRTAEGFTGDLLVRSPMTRIAHYEATLTPEGNIGWMKVDWSTPPENPDGPPPASFTVTIEGDSASVEATSAQGSRTARIAVPPGVIPGVGKNPVSFAVLEQAAHQALTSGEDTYPLNIISVARARIGQNALTRLSGDTVSMDFFGSQLLSGIDEEGRVLWRSGARTTLKVEGTRVDDLDFASLAADYAARDARGEGMGVASPEATLDVSVGGADITIVYSQPSKRGREIWGGLVPWSEVWRTGANAATAFSTSRDLVIGRVLVPAGDYTLFSIYTAESAYLIINKQTGQWGTMYDEAQDHARIEMNSEPQSELAEQFTISIESADDGAGGVIRMSWDATSYFVPFTVR